MQHDDANEARSTIARLEAGDPDAADQLIPILYRQLHDLAFRIVPNHAKRATLQPTALVHEAYIRLAGLKPGDWNDHAHFLAIGAHAMRQVLADHARRKHAEKRGGDWAQVTLDDAVRVTNDESIDLAALDAALDRLRALDERKADVVELRFFAGLTNEQVAAHLGLSRSTIADDWTIARAWLRSELSKPDN